MSDRPMFHSDPPGNRDRELADAGLAPVRQVKPLVFNPNNAVTGVVERLSLLDGSEVVRKVLLRDAPTTVPHWPAGRGTGHWNYWRREAEAYLGGKSSILPGVGLRAPELLGRCSPADGAEVLFLEHVEGRSGAELGGADLAALAAGLGRWQGAVAGRAEPRSWWSRDWMWTYASSRPVGPGGYEDDEAWAHPLVVEGFGERLELIRTGFARLHSELEQWRSVAALLPPVPSHLDSWANNAIVPVDTEPVLFDWSFCGLAHIGADAGNLVPDGLLDHYADPGSFAHLDERVTEAYLGGLDDAGWTGDPLVVRLGICMAPGRFSWMPALMVANATWSGPTGYGGQQGLDHVEVFRRRSVVFAAMLDQLEEARSLAGRLGLAA